MPHTRVLFLCTGNTARSQMAEAILRQSAGDRYEAHSAGLDPSAVRPEVFTVLEEVGISTEGLRSKGVDEYLGKVHVNYVITLCAHAEAHCPRIWPPGGEKIFWPIDDPAAMGGTQAERLEAFRRARDKIVSLIDEWIAGREKQAETDGAPQ